MKAIVTTHGTVHGEPISSTVRTDTGGADLRPYVSIGTRFYSEPDAKELLRALGEAVREAWPTRCLDETVGPCRKPQWDGAPEKWCANCRAAGKPLGVEGK